MEAPKIRHLKSSIALLKKTGDRLRAKRKKRKLSQLEVSKRIQLSHRHYQKIEAGSIDLKLTTLYALSNAIGFPGCALLHGIGESDNSKQNLEDCPQQIIDEVPVGIFLCDLKGKMIYRNRILESRAAIRQEVLDFESWLGLFRPDNQSTVREHFIRTAQGESLVADVLVAAFQPETGLSTDPVRLRMKLLSRLEPEALVVIVLDFNS